MDMLMSLHKHLNIKSIQYLSRLIANLDLSQHNEQTLLLSALLTKNLWFLMLDMGDKKETNKPMRKIKSSEDIDLQMAVNANTENNNSNSKKYDEQKVKIKLLNSNKSESNKFARVEANNQRNKKLDKKSNRLSHNQDESNEASDESSNKHSNLSNTNSNCSANNSSNSNSRAETENEDEEDDDDIINTNNTSKASALNTREKKIKIIPQKSKLLFITYLLNKFLIHLFNLSKINLSLKNKLNFFWNPCKF